MEQNNTPHNENVQFATIYKMASAIVTAALLVIGAAVFSLSFESSSRYMSSSPAVIALYAAIGITVIFALSTVFILKGLFTTLPSAPINRIIAAISAVASAVPFIYYIYSDVSAKFAAISATPGSLAATYNGLDVISVIIMITAAISMICSLYLIIRDSKAASLLACYSRAICLALIITKLYLDFSVELNSPVKILVQFAAVAVMLATTAKLRPIIGKFQAAPFMSTQFLSVALCMLSFVLLLAEIAPHTDKYTTDLLVFPIMLMLFGVEGIVLLLSCRVTPNMTPVEKPLEANDSAPEQSEVETNGAAAEIDEPQEKASPEPIDDYNLNNTTDISDQ